MSLTPETLSFAGDITIEKLSVVSTDGTQYSLMNQVAALQIFEDLYSPFITGTIVIKDSLDFVNALPVIGQEWLDIDISTPTLKEKGGRIKGQFSLYRVKNREYLGDKSVMYELDFISKEAITDSNIKISKGFTGRVSDIVKQILSDKQVAFDSVKSLVIEETNNATRYVSNYWSPVQNVNYLAQTAKNQSNSPSYIFFENRDGFNFGSLNTLVASPTISQKFNYNSYTRSVTNSGAYRDINMDYQRITEFIVKEGVNTIDRLRDGFMASTVVTNDVTTKTFEYKYYNALVGNLMTNHLNKHPLINYKFPIDYGAKFLVMPKQQFGFSSFSDATNTDIIQQRLYEMAEKNDFKVNIVVPGRLDYTVGQVVEINSVKVEPLRQSDSLSDATDEIYSGKYLITAINHFITREKHECTMELAKDSYIADFSQARQQ